MYAPRPDPASAGPPLKRRQLLGGAAAVAGLVVGGWAASGCTGDPTPPVPTPPATPDLDDAIVAAATASVHQLLDAYDATAQAHADEAGRLEPLAAEHRVHLQALGEFEPSSPLTGSTSPQLSSAPAVPADPAAAVGALVTAEQAAAADRITATVGASPGLARVLAAIGASEAAHVALLSAGA